MRFTDVVALALSSLRLQRGRTVLSLIGVVVGSLILIFSLAAQGGIQEAVVRVFSENDEMRQVELYPSYDVPENEIPPEQIRVQGGMGKEKRERIRQALIRKWRQENFRTNVGITRQRLSELESLPHVVKVIPAIDLNCWAVFGDHEEQIELSGVTADNDVLQERIVAGQNFADDHDPGVLIHEFLAYQWGAVSESEMLALVGKRIRLEIRYRAEAVARSLALRPGREVDLSSEQIVAFDRALNHIASAVDELPLAEDEKDVIKKVFPNEEEDQEEPVTRVVTDEFSIRGIFRGATPEELESGIRLNRFRVDGMVLMAIGTATDYFYNRFDDGGVGMFRASAVVDHEGNLRPLTQRLRELGYQEYSLIRLVESIERHVTFITWVFVAVAGVALFVAAVGIMNTMIMSVIERTHEIGVMKATGARDRQVLSIFLIEGALVGALGAAAAIFISWGMAFGIDYAIRLIIEREIQRSFDETVLRFDWWVFAAVIAFASVVAMLAAIVPARRAARVSPVAALRHE